MKRLVVSAALLSLALLCGGAFAQTRTIGGQGAWTAYGGRSESGVPVCGMQVDGSEQRTLHMKWYAGNEHLTMQAFKASWNIPRGTRLPLVIDVDRRVSWNVPQAWGGGTVVEWTVTQRTFNEFVSAFRYGQTLTVAFPGGSETPWVASLRGSLATFDLFARCILAIGEGPTQPHGRSAGPPDSGLPKGNHPTQPFR